MLLPVAVTALLVALCVQLAPTADATTAALLVSLFFAWATFLALWRAAG